MSYPHRGEPLPDGKCGRESASRESVAEKLKSFFEREGTVFGDGVVELVPVEEPEK